MKKLSNSEYKLLCHQSLNEYEKYIFFLLFRVFLSELSGEDVKAYNEGLFRILRPFYEIAQSQLNIQHSVHNA